MNDILRRHVFLISLLLHLLLLLSFSVVWKAVLPDEEKPAEYVPAYVYHPPVAVMPSPKVPPAPKQKAHPLEKTEKGGLEKRPAQEASPQTEAPAQTMNRQAAFPLSQQTQPIHLIGNKKLDQPLIRLLGQALARHLIYPRLAVDFNLHGISYIGFLLHPNGQVSQVRLMKSSGADILDQAALKGVAAMSPVVNVETYLHKERFLVVGIIFG